MNRAAGRGTPLRRAGWHRRISLIPVTYLAATAALSVAHPFVQHSHWLMIHLMMLGVAANAIIVWGAHFTAAILRTPVPESHRGEAVRLVILNAGVLSVLTGGAVGPAWLGAIGSVMVFVAVAAHAWALSVRLRRALPTRFAITVHYYLAGTVALLAGIPAGAMMLLLDVDQRPRLLLFHAHVNLLGFVALTVLGTLLTLWPTVLRTQIAPGAGQAAVRALRLCLAALACLSIATLAWWPTLAATGLALFAAAVVLVSVPAVTAARQRPPASFAAWSIAAAIGWLAVALVWDTAAMLTAPDAASAADRFVAILPLLGGGFVAQILLAALSYLLPVVLGGGPVPVRRRSARLDAHWPQRTVMANLSLAIYLLPVPAYVRIAAALLILAAMIQFLVPVARILLSPADRLTAAAPPTAEAEPSPHIADRRPWAGVAAGVSLVLLATVVAVIGQYAAQADASPVATDVAPTGHTTTVAVTARGMRFQPDQITVPVGDRLVITLTNVDHRRHDLVLATGQRTSLLGEGETVRLDAGVIAATVHGWCSQPAHRQSGMTFTIIPSTGSEADPKASSQARPSAAAPSVDAMKDPGPSFAAHDAALAPAPKARVHRITLHARQVRRDVAAGVSQTLWTFDGDTPGPVLRGHVGDLFEITLVNDTAVEHGIDFHVAALAPDVGMRTVEPGDSTVYRFTADKAGIWMYHCSAMPMLYHIGNGMYGALIIDPPDLAPVDREYLLVQSEFYLGAQGQPGDLARMRTGRPDAVVFNGYASQYTFRPLEARTGRRLRIWLLNAGPNGGCAFHVVGAPFDAVYAEGAYRLRSGGPGGAQILDLAPASGGFVEITPSQPGSYPFLTHVMADADRGAQGVIIVVD